MSRGRVLGSVVGLATIAGTIFSGAALYMYAADNSWLDGVSQRHVAGKVPGKLLSKAPPLPALNDAPRAATLRPAVFAKPRPAKRRVASRVKTRPQTRRRTVNIFMAARDIEYPTRD